MKKHKSILLSICALFISISLSAQNYAQGEMNANVGMGIASSFTGKTQMPPVSASFEIGAGNNIAVGVVGGIATTEKQVGLSSGKSYTWKHQNLFFGGRGLYYFYSNTDINLYGGAMGGYNSVSSDFSTNDDITEKNTVSSEAGGLAYNVFIGGRYFFSRRVGAYLEAGLGNLNLNAGLSIKF